MADQVQGTSRVDRLAEDQGAVRLGESEAGQGSVQEEQ